PTPSSTTTTAARTLPRNPCRPPTLAASHPPFGDDDAEKHQDDADQLATPTPVDRRDDDHRKERDRQHQCGGRHERRTHRYADGGCAFDWGSDGAGEAWPVRRIRRRAHATGP